MKALNFNPENDQFSINDMPMPSFSDDEVLVHVEACGLNPVDAKIKFWKGMAPHMDHQWVGGLDVSGYIEKVGEKVFGWQVGDRVLYHGDMFKPHGGFAEYAVTKASTLVKHPEELSAEIAAAVPCAAWTAYRAIVDKLKVAENESMLIVGASGGVGVFAIQFAVFFGMDPIIAVNSSSNNKLVSELGATHIVNYDQEDVKEAVMKITHGLGVDKAMDLVGGDNDLLVASTLGFEGEMLELVGTVRPKEYDDAFMRGLSFHQLSLGAGHRNGEKGINTLTSAGKAVNQMLEDGEIEVPLSKVITLEEMPETLNKILEKHTVGKIVLRL